MLSLWHLEFSQARMKKVNYLYFIIEKSSENIRKVYPVRSQGWKRLVLKTEKGEMAELRDLQLSAFSRDWLEGENNGAKASDGTLRSTVIFFCC